MLVAGLSSEEFSRALRTAVLGSAPEVPTVDVDIHGCLKRLGMANFPHNCLPTMATVNMLATKADRLAKRGVAKPFIFQACQCFARMQIAHVQLLCFCISLRS